MSDIRTPQNPGISGLDELTVSEELTLQNISGLGDPNADRILFWDDSAGGYRFLTAGTGLTIAGTTITSDGVSIGGTVTGATEGSVLFAGPSGALAQDNSNFFWDNTNNRFGIGTASPSQTLAVNLGLEQVYGVNSDGVATFPHSLGTGYSYLRAPSGRGFRLASDSTVLVTFPSSTASTLVLGYAGLQIGDSSSPGTSIYLNSIGASDLNLRAGDGNVSRTADVILSVKDNQEVARATDTLRFGVGTGASPGGRFAVKGAGATSATTNLILTDSADRSMFEVNDAGFIGMSTTPSSLWKLDFVGQYFQMGSDGTSNNLRTDATNKLFGIVTPHYTNAQNPVWAIGVQTTTSTNLVSIGGGVTSGANAATGIQFATNSTNTGGVGVVRMALTNTILRLGSGDQTSTPAAVEIRAPRVAGVADTAGVHQTYVSGFATGNANSGDHIWQSGLIGTSGSTTQTVTTRMTLKGGTGYLGIGTTTPDQLLHEEVSDAGTNAVVFGQRHTHITSGTVTTGFGIGEEYELENASGTNRVAATQAIAWTDATNASEDASWTLQLMRAGTLATGLSLSSVGALTVNGAYTLPTAVTAANNYVLTAQTDGSTAWAAAGAGTVTSVSGTTNRITVATGTTTPVIDISATFEALLGKVANRIDQNNAATTSAQLASVISDETGSGALVFGTSPNITTPTGIVKGDVGLGNVDNTSDATKNSATATVTNKRNQPRTASSTSNANLDPDLSTANVYFRTTQTTGLTIGAPTGTPVIGETIAIYVDSAGAQTLTINSTYKVFGTAFPASTTAGKTFMLTAQFNGTDWKTTWANAV